LPLPFPSPRRIILCANFTTGSMSPVWKSGRPIRAVLGRIFSFRIAVKCRCGRGFGFVYGTEHHATSWYEKGHLPYIFTAYGGPVRFTCSPRCRGDYPIRHDVFQAAYLATIAKPKDQRVLILPYDVKGLQPVTRRIAAVRLDGPLIGR
jgi:hypothetical protein